MRDSRYVDQVGWCYGSGFPKSHDVSKGIDRAATDAAREWQGWGTALKPAWEPIVLARKPLSEPTIAANVLKWRNRALNIDKCRIGTEERHNPSAGNIDLENRISVTPISKHSEMDGRSAIGRWPANLIHDGSEEVLARFPDLHASGASSRGEMSGVHDYGFNGHGQQIGYESGSGSAARFFYTAKADSDDRLGSKHPTVKPLDLMQYLVRLVTPHKGTVLDCFAGTGTTGEAAWREGMRAILIEREPQYIADIRRRMALVLSGPDERAREAIKERTKDKPLDAGPLFGGTP